MTGFVVLFVPLAIYLGMWQFDRGDQRDEFNQDLLAQLRSQPKPLQTASDLATLVEWAPIVSTGEFDTNTDILVRRRTQDGLNGFYVLTPFETSNGQLLMVNRGWLRAVGAASFSPDVPLAPAGTQELTTRWRGSEMAYGPLPADLPNYQVSTVDLGQIAQEYPEVGDIVTKGYLQSETALGGDDLQPVRLPALSAGPHLGYALQWLIFGSIAIVGWVLLLKREVKPR